MDPLADKLLVGAAMICLIPMDNFRPGSSLSLSAVNSSSADSGWWRQTAGLSLPQAIGASLKRFPDVYDYLFDLDLPGHTAVMIEKLLTTWL